MIDAHVHFFPERLLEAIWSWFDQHAWPIRRKMHAQEAIDRLLQAGTDRAVALVYAHKADMAPSLNRWVGRLARSHPMVIAGATAHPMDRDIGGLLRAARDVHGARVVKQHCHVLGVGPDDPAMFPLYETCITLGLPLVLHSGSGPKLRGYQAPTDAVSGAVRTEAVLRRYPELRLVVPHLGCTDEDAFLAMLGRYPNLYLDTTMALEPHVPGAEVPDRRVIAQYAGRIMFGTDTPNTPWELDTERRALEALQLPAEAMHEILHGTAARLFGVG